MGSAWIVILFALVCGFARAERLEDLDAVLQRAGSLDAFLAAPALLDEYYGKLAIYYGADKIPRASFDRILEQLREVGAKIPELKQRLWDTRNMGEPFAVATATQSYGRKLDARAWGRYSREIFDGWRKESAGVDAKGAKRALAAFSDETRAFEAGLADKKRADAEAARREYYATKRRDPTLQAAAAHLLLGKFESEGMQDRLRSGDADLILDTFNELRGGLKKSFLRDGMDLGAATSLLQERIPPLAQMLARQDAFPVEMRRTTRGKDVPAGSSGKTTYYFRPPPRRFHAIWKGVPLGECVRENVQRWATVALTGTQFYHVEKETTLEGGEVARDYLGFVQAVPLKKDGEIYGSLDLGAPVLRQKAFAHDPLVGDIAPTTLYDLWLEQMRRRLPETWKGLVLGESGAIGNAGVLPTAREDFSYRTGTVVGTSKQLEYLDDFADRLVAVARPAGNSYGGGMIFDARTGNADRQRLLGQSWRTRYTDGASIVGALTGEDAELARAAAREVARRPNLLPEIKAEVARLPSYPYLLEWGRHETRIMDMRARGQVAKEVPAAMFGGIGTAFAGIFTAMAIHDPNPAYITFAAFSGVLPVMMFGFFGRHYPRLFAAEVGSLRAQAQAERVRAGRSSGPSIVGGLGIRCRAAWRVLFPPPVLH